MNKAAKILIGVFTSVGILLLSQCSPYAGKSVLHVFFDGVPETDSTLSVMEEQGEMLVDSSDYVDGALASAEPEGMMHYPYEERECASCHDEQALGTMVEPQPGLCYICHEDLSERYNYLHGPVAGGYCTACHNPHSSENEKLLRLRGEELCFFCHKEEGVLGNEMHEDLDGMLCTDCHNPHGGEDKYIFQ